jgi:uncharacterized protein YecT (DUF1311 family)
MRVLQKIGAAFLMGLAVAGAGSAQDAVQSGQIDCSEAQTQADINTCARLDFQEADSNLNFAYKAALAQMKATDAAGPDMGAEAALRAAQRAWVAFRDLACASEGWSVHGGSIEPMVVLQCLARLSTARADDLWSLSEDGGG